MTKTRKSKFKKIKILVFCEFFYPHKNGVSEYILNLYSELLKKGLVEVSVVTYNNTNSPEHEFYNGFEIFRVACKSLLGGTYNLPKLNVWKKISSKLSVRNYDIVNTHTRFFTMSYLGYRFARKNKIKLVHTEHGAMFVPHPNFVVKSCARIYDETLGRRVISRADVVCTISKAGIDFVKRLGAKNVELVHNCVSRDFTKFSETQIENLKQDFKISSDRLNLVFVGRVVEAKGLKELFVALSDFKSKFHLYVIGDGNYLGFLKNFAQKLGLESKVSFLGYRNQDFIRNFLPLMEVFVNPSYAEGLPTSVLEAGISGLKVVATNVGGTCEIVVPNKTGCLIRPHSVEEILRGINEVSSEKGKNYGENLRKLVLRDFVWDKAAKSFYEKVLNNIL